ncbi:MAG: 2,3-bisphosphoglycerate-independent phosphoglycerate mutase [Rhodobacteraceae bacterium]|nr:2,3-bisphosphoglycerate-independent phosphoglycerate mutase [Paracoccaceae bacterium]
MTKSAHGTVALCILDGWGLSSDSEGNAVALASTPTYDWLMANCPNSRLVTHGSVVGLPDGCIGNSEVGHLHIGAGRTVLMDIQRITRAMEEGRFGGKETIAGIAGRTRAQGGRMHLCGIISEVGVHGLASHMAATAKTFDGLGVQCLIHAVTDGRDDLPGKALSQLEWLNRNLPASAEIASVIGRYYAMDRDRRWDRVEMAWRAIALGEGLRAASPRKAVHAAVKRGETDEFIKPTLIRPDGAIGPDDGVFFTNFRSDRMRQIVSAVADPGFSGFRRDGKRMPASVGSMVSYFDPPREWIRSVFSKPRIENTLGQWVSQHGRTQFRIAETEKYPHVTYFLNGGSEARFPGEVRRMPQSPMVATYDLVPEMAVEEVGKGFVEAANAGFDLIVVNFANPDMVGHTGDLAAAARACEATDRALGLGLDAMERCGGKMVVTADHGNCEQMIDPETGGPHTAHTTNPVPIVLFGGNAGWQLRTGSLTDLAPTVLDLMKLPQPPEMTGRSLVIRSPSGSQ